MFSPTRLWRAETRHYPIKAAASEGATHTFLGMWSIQALRERSWQPFSTASLAAAWHRLPPAIYGAASQLFLDAKQLIVLGYTIGPRQ